MKKTLKFGCLGAIGLVILLAILVAVTPSPQSTAPAAPAAENLAVLAVTPTPEPLPEVILEPAATPAGFVPTADEQAYTAELGEILNDYSKAANILGEQMTAAGNDIALFRDEAWILRTATGVVIFELSNETILNMDAPPRFADAHNDLLIMADHYERSMSLITNGIDNLDAENLNQGWAELLLGNDAMNRSSEKFTALQQGN